MSILNFSLFSCLGFFGCARLVDRIFLCAGLNFVELWKGDSLFCIHIAAFAVSNDMGSSENLALAS